MPNTKIVDMRGPGQKGKVRCEFLIETDDSTWVYEMWLTAELKNDVIMIEGPRTMFSMDSDSFKADGVLGRE